MDFVRSKFNNDNICEIFYVKNRLWIEILNKSFEDTIKIGVRQLLGFVVVEPENLNFQYYVPSKKKAKKDK